VRTFSPQVQKSRCKFEGTLGAVLLVALGEFSPLQATGTRLFSSSFFVGVNLHFHLSITASANSSAAAPTFDVISLSLRRRPLGGADNKEAQLKWYMMAQTKPEPN
jgi:hypothetical protein